jgi:3-oxoacyl-[acyl-carrier protein] reductase
VRVNGIAPGLIPTRFTEYTVGNPERLAANLERIPLGRLGTTADIANVALFLASPLSAYMVGETLTVDGGRILE